MSALPVNKPDSATTPKKHTPVWLWVVVWLVLAAGLAIRLYDLTDPPLDFHPTLQLHTALIARQMYAEMGGNFPDWERQRIISIGRSEVRIEPPILETLVALTYRLVHGEYLWIARIYSSLIWVLAGLALFDLAVSLSGPAGGLISLLFYLFLPFAAIASRTFQSDPSMVAWMIVTAWLLDRWQDHPGWKLAIFTGLVGGMSVLTKQVAVFIVGGLTLEVMLSRYGLVKALRNAQVWVMGVVMLLPTTIYNVYGIWIAKYLQGEYSLRFFPKLWLAPAFYIRWANKIDQTVGVIPLLLAMAGVLLITTRVKRSLLIGWVGGYLVYGLVFAYHISTHDYYQLPILPLTALGLAPLAEAIYSTFTQMKPGRLVYAVMGALVISAVLVSAWNIRYILHSHDYRKEPAFWTEISQDMGFDGARVIGLLDDYGYRLMYWGLMTPAYWPSTGDVQMRLDAGQEASIGEFGQRAGGKWIFVVTNLKDFENQPELKAILTHGYSIYKQGNGYVIFDLRKPKAAP